MKTIKQVEIAPVFLDDETFMIHPNVMEFGKVYISRQWRIAQR